MPYPHNPQEERDRTLIIDESVNGQRVRLINMDDPDPVQQSDVGTAQFWNNATFGSSLAVKWDSGRMLSLVEGVDEWEWID